MWKTMLSAYEGDRYRTGRHRARRPGSRPRGPRLVARGVRVLLLGMSENQRVSGPWQAHAMWQVCGITRMPSGTTEDERAVEG